MAVLSFKRFKEVSVLFSMLVMLLVGFAYFRVDGVGNSAGGMADSKESKDSIYGGIQLKLAFTGKGEAKAFALAKNNELAKLAAFEGKSIPENSSMVLGNAEAKIMAAEKLFSKQGDKIRGFFGISTSIEGVLAKTDSPLDYMHFLGPVQFSEIGAFDEGLFANTSAGMPKLFYRNDYSAALPGNLRLSEGKFKDYELHEIVGKKYYPMIIGSEEAKIMREEKAFSKIGDVFEKFGKQFIIVGILEKNNSIFDTAHIVPLSKAQLAESGKG